MKNKSDDDMTKVIVIRDSVSERQRGRKILTLPRSYLYRVAPGKK